MNFAIDFEIFVRMTNMLVDVAERVVDCEGSDGTLQVGEEKDIRRGYIAQSGAEVDC